MAQAKRKRTRKHRGTAAGTIERAGRTGRPRTREEAKKISRQRRAARFNKPPTWKGSITFPSDFDIFLPSLSTMWPRQTTFRYVIESKCRTPSAISV